MSKYRSPVGRIYPPRRTLGSLRDDGAPSRYAAPLVQGVSVALRISHWSLDRGQTIERNVSINLDWLANFIWGIADDVLRDLYVRSKYRDVILPMTVLRRLDAVLEHTKDEVLATKARLDAVGVENQDLALRQAAGQAFYNTSPFTMRELRARTARQALKIDFEAYLDGFSPNVQEIIDGFEFRNQLTRLSGADAIGALIEKFLDPRINLSPD